MDFGFTEEQDELAGLARRILTDQVTEELLREVEAGIERFDPDTWRELAKANLLGIALPEDVGGTGYGLIEQCLVLREIGRTVAPVPVLASIVMGAMPIAEFGSAEQRERWVRPAADGEVILTAALVEPLNPDPARPSTTARQQDGAWRIDGVKTCVPAATLADLFVVPAATAAGEVGVFLVAASAPGLTVSRQETTNGDVEGYLELDGVIVPVTALLGGLDDGARIVAWIAERATVGLCAMQVGITERALEMTAEYTQGRVQFERAIATFQAVGQRCADAYIDVEGIRLSLWQAAWRLAEGLPATAEVEVAKFWASDGGHRVVHAAVHLHGGMGIAVDYPLHRYFNAAKKVEFTLGAATEQLLRLGRVLAAEPV